MVSSSTRLILRFLLDDARLALRWARGRPGFLALAAASLALGLGANLAVFSVIDALLLRPFPHVEAPEELVAVKWLSPDGERENPSGPDARDLREMQEVFADVVAHDRFDFSVRTSGRTERLRGELVSAAYFETLGVSLTRGGGFSSGAAVRPSAEAVISFELWQRAFGGDDDAVGESLGVNGRELSIVGVAPRGFRGIEVGAALDVWVPDTMRAALWPGTVEFHERRDLQGPSLVARVRAGVAHSEARAAIATLGQRLVAAFPRGGDDPGTLGLVPFGDARLPDWLRDSVHGLLPVLAIVAGLIFLMACTNVAGLRLVELAEREGELAVRAAMGAGRLRLARQLILENVFLYGLALSVSLVVARLTQRLFEATPLFATYVWPPELGLDGRVVGYAVVLAAVASAGFGFVPALRLRRLALPGRAPGSGPSSSRSARRTRAAFVLVQVGLSALLLVGTGLLARSLHAAYRTDPGYRLDDVLFVSAHLRSLEHRYDEPRSRAFYRAVLDEVRTIRGVESAAWSADTPFLRMTIGTMFVPEDHPDAGEPEPEWVRADADVVSPGFLRTMGVPLLRGRDLRESDGENAPGVVLVNETLARAHWEGQEALGKRVRMWQRQGQERRFYEVVGVVADARYRTPWEEPRPYLYLPLYQRHFLNMNLHVHVDGDPMAYAPAVREAIARIDGELPVFDARPLSEELAALLAPQRAAAALFGVSAGLALVLAALGAYSVVAYAVGRRTREIGLRMAIGATPTRIRKLVVGESARTALAGLALGLAASWILARYLESLLVLVSPRDPVVFVSAGLILTAASVLASYFPARRAARVDPAAALRQE